MKAPRSLIASLVVASATMTCLVLSVSIPWVIVPIPWIVCAWAIIADHRAAREV